MQRAGSIGQRAYRFINRPYYWWHPSQLVRRMGTRPPVDGDPKLLRTAWGSWLYFWPDPLGRAVARNGVYDLAVAETLARLVDPGETVVDAGANVGVMSNLLARATGPAGRVVAFEPHPVIYETLIRNVERTRSIDGLDVIDARRAAVSSVGGEVSLGIDPEEWAENKGTASLEHSSSAVAVASVRGVRLDTELDGPIGVLKLDVEMHELEALRGGEGLLARGLVRDIVFEEHSSPPTPVTELLESHGYTVLGVSQGLLRPTVGSAKAAYERQLHDPPALLATIDPARARERLRAPGWRCLRSGFGVRR